MLWSDEDRKFCGVMKRLDKEVESQRIQRNNKALGSSLNSGAYLHLTVMHKKWFKIPQMNP